MTSPLQQNNNCSIGLCAQSTHQYTANSVTMTREIWIKGIKRKDESLDDMSTRCPVAIRPATRTRPKHLTLGM